MTPGKTQKKRKASRGGKLKVTDNPIRKGRGSNVADARSFTDAPLVDFYDLVSTATSDSTKANIKHATKVISEYSAVKGAPDLTQITVESFKFVLNLLADYCKFGSPNSLKNDSIGALVQGLRHLYCQHGHTRTWFVDEANGVTRGNPLIGNPELEALRRAHRVLLAYYGSMTLRARPITVEHVCDMKERFWYGRGCCVHIEDVLLHSILVVGLNLGFRYDEIAKLRVENCLLVLDTNAGLILDTTKSWSAKKFTACLRKRLSEIGVGDGDVKMYSGHSIKRGCVQLYRSLGLRDEAIMEKIQMTGQHAYANYCAAYKDCAQNPLPRFHSISEYIKHAEKVAKESEIVHNREAFGQFMVEVWGKDEVDAAELLET